MPQILLTSLQTVTFLDKTYPCHSGKNGIRHNKIEGDGTTPIGIFPLRRVFYRADRVTKPITSLPCVPITLKDGWCDDPSDALHYNKLISLPYSKSHETLWREDGVYDLVVEVGYNDDPIILGKGSAIFIHLKRPLHDPHYTGSTEGCLAFAYPDLLHILKGVTMESCLVVKEHVAEEL